MIIKRKLFAFSLLPTQAIQNQRDEVKRFEAETGMKRTGLQKAIAVGPNSDYGKKFNEWKNNQ